MKKKLKIGIPVCLIVALIIASFLYVNDYYRSSEEATAYLGKTGEVEIQEIDGGLFLDGPGTEDAMIFYPGGKVEYTAYLPLLYQLAEEGMDVFLLKMPCNLAIFGVNKANDILNEYSYENYYMGGHSLGGVMASSYAAKHAEKLKGVLFLAAYPTKDLSASGLKTLTIYGSEDQVLNIDKVESTKDLLPEDAKIMVIEGGNHGQFGSYGEQKGDGAATISAEEQWKQTVEAILEDFK
jgi:dienelactone hydrolase